MLTVRFPDFLWEVMEFVKILSIKGPPFEVILVGMVIDGAKKIIRYHFIKSRVSLCF